MTELKEFIRSLVPGRVRIRHRALKALTSDDENLLVQTLKAIEGILAVRVNSAVGSLLIVWDEDILSERDLREALAFPAAALGIDVSDGKEPLLQALPQTGAAAVSQAGIAQTLMGSTDALAMALAPGVKNIKRARRMAQNRVMLGLGAACVAALAMNKRLHGVLGYAFTVLALVHSYQHRRVI